MAKINDIEGLRDHLLETLEKLDKRKIELEEASIVAKLAEGVVSGLKTQLEYARLNNSSPLIPFLAKSTRMIKNTNNKPKLIEG